MSVVGDVYYQGPDPGWQRFEESDPRFTYIDGVSAWSGIQYYGSCSNTGYRYANSSSLNAAVRFNFYGSKLRIANWGRCYCSDKVEVIIDGISRGFYNERAYDLMACVLQYEITGLDMKEHSVEVVNRCADNAGDNYMYWDCIEIDSDGSLLPYSPIAGGPNAPSALTGVVVK